MPNVIQRIVTSAFRIDRNAFEPVFAVRSAIGVVVAILAGYSTGVPIYAVAAGIGAMSAGFGSLQGVYRTRAATMTEMALAMSFSTAIGSLCSHSAELGVLAVGVWGFGYGMIAALGPGAAAIAVNATIALVIFEHFPQPLHVAVGCALIMFAGGLFQTLLLVVLWPIQRYPQERRALAAAYRDLGNYAAGAQSEPRVPLSLALTVVRKTLADPRPFGRRPAAAAFQTLLDEAERIRATLALLTTNGSEEFARVRPQVAATLRGIADALERARAPDEKLRELLDVPASDATVGALYGQLRAAWRSARVPLGGISIPRSVPYPRHFPQLEAPLATIRKNLRLDSQFGRHAVRLAVVLMIAGVLSHVLPIARGYWITLTAALVLRPDFTTTLSRGLARIAGTIVGAVAATAIVLAVPDTPHVYLTLAIVFAVLGYAAFQLNYALFSLTITAYVVFILSLLGTPESAAVQNRLIATLAGGLLAMLSYAVWPTWEAPHTRKRLRTLVELDFDYTRLLFAGLIDPAKRDLARMREQRVPVWNARSAAEESLERMLAEPLGTHDLEGEVALGITAAEQRLALANTALSSLYEDSSTPAFPELAQMANVLAGVTPDHAQGLRDAYDKAAHALSGRSDANTAALLISCDLVVDSTNTIVELWERATS